MKYWALSKTYGNHHLVNSFRLSGFGLPCIKIFTLLVPVVPVWLAKNCFAGVAKNQERQTLNPKPGAAKNQEKQTLNP